MDELETRLSALTVEEQHQLLQFLMGYRPDVMKPLLEDALPRFERSILAVTR